MTAEIFDERDFEIFSLGMKYASDVAAKTGRGYTAMIAIRDEMAKQRQRFTSYLMKNEVSPTAFLRKSGPINSKAAARVVSALLLAAFIFSLCGLWDHAQKRVDEATKESNPPMASPANYYPPDFNGDIPPDWLHPERAQ